MGILSALSKWSKTNNLVPLNRTPYIPGTIIEGRYTNYKQDPNPLVLVLWSGNIRTRIRGFVHLTHGINLKYLTITQRDRIIRLLFDLRIRTYKIDPREFYIYLSQITSETQFSVKRLNKRRFLTSRSVKRGYRTYFTSYLIAKVVSPGYFTAPIPIYPSRYMFVKKLNQMILGVQSQDFTNVIRDREAINDLIEKTLNRTDENAYSKEEQEEQNNQGEQKE